MISESCYWKDELYRCYITIAKFINQKKYFEASYVNVEKAIMLSAYFMRKLDDAEKIPPDFLKSSITLSAYFHTDKIVDHYTVHDFDKNYDFGNEEKETKSIIFFLDQIIHSFSYSIVFSDDLKIPEGFFLNSDRTKNSKLFYFPLKKYLELILKISEGWIDSQYNERDEKTLEMKLVKATYMYPDNFKLKKSIEDTFNGKIYKRNKNEE